MLFTPYFTKWPMLWAYVANAVGASDFSAELGCKPHRTLPCQPLACFIYTYGAIFNFSLILTNLIRGWV